LYNIYTKGGTNIQFEVVRAPLALLQEEEREEEEEGCKAQESLTGADGGCGKQKKKGL
jgi:hypothetical protein